MLFVWLSHAEAGEIVDALPSGELRHKLQRVMAADLLPDDGSPRTVVIRDEGDGMRVAAVEYHDAKAADKAWDSFMDKAQHPERVPTKRKRTAA